MPLPLFPMVQESDVPECLVSYLAVEAGNLRALLQGLAQALADKAQAVAARNRWGSRNGVWGATVACRHWRGVWAAPVLAKGQA